ncbi:MAG TPA: MFS transporter [Acidisarcina sp.]|nr:MFS transporter [Acidisarcina sp.]
MTLADQQSEEHIALTRRIVRTAFLSFLCYLCIGIQLAVLPSFVHLDLGYMPLMAGLAISMQYVATLVTRPWAGHMGDTLGAKRTVMKGQVYTTCSGAVLLLAALLRHRPLLSLLLLLASRLLLGAGESCTATGVTIWGMGRVGQEHTAEVISWSGIATYGALAIGAPVGVWVNGRFGLGSLAVLVLILSFAGYVLAAKIAAVRVIKGESLTFQHVLGKVFPHGMSLALGTVGFGAIASFITLYYANRQWNNAAFSLSVFGLCFIATRLLFARSIERRGGFPVALVSLAVETVGLVLLWLASTSSVALLGAGLTGTGFALVFPALGVEAVRTVSPANSGSALGLYNAFMDLAMGITGPIAGLIISGYGYSGIFLFAAVMCVGGILLTVAIYRRATQSRQIDEA